MQELYFFENYIASHYTLHGKILSQKKYHTYHKYQKYHTKNTTKMDNNHESGPVYN